MDLSIIIINYKSTQLVLDCMESIYAQTHRHSFEIIVVDNYSEDNNSKEKILDKYPSVQWLQMNYNSGFARANNAGIKIASGDAILLLNADTIILDNAIDKTLDLFAQYPQAAGCGVQLLNVDRTHQASGAHVMRGGLNMLLPLPYLGRALKKLGQQFNVTPPSVVNVPEVLSVDWIVGAFLLVRKNILHSSGLLDEDFFMYAEEIEWCSRLKKQGDLLLFSTPEVIHIGGGTSSDYYNADENMNGRNLWDKKARQERLSNLLRVRKQFGIAWFIFITFAYFIEIPIFFFGLLAEKIVNPKRVWYKWEHVWGYTKNVLVMLTYFFKILANKPYFYKVL
jgi:GT2 family glycosyltransferase